MREASLGTLSASKLHSILESLFDDLFPLCRSISGYGIEQTLDYLSRFMPLQVTHTPPGTKVFDWDAPPQWNFHRARLWDPSGTLICDSNNNNLHVMSYSEPVDCQLPLDELRKHLYSLPQVPDAVPYVTSYYKRRWGFCLTENQLAQLPDGTYKVKIESSFSNKGGVPYATCVLPGESSREVLISSYVCHPSMANNELSGPLTLLGLFLKISTWKKRRLSYRFVLNPETIGSLCFLKDYAEHLKQNLLSGMILTCIGGPFEQLRYKASFSGMSLLDQLIRSYANRNEQSYSYSSFSPLSGSDERQYGAPGFRLPVAQMSRAPVGEYPGYHSSADTKESMGIESLVDSVERLELLLKDLEIAGCAKNLCPFGEPQLGKRGLYPTINAPSSEQNSQGRAELNKLLMILNRADGETNMLSVANELDIPVSELRETIEKLENAGLLSYS